MVRKIRTFVNGDFSMNDNSNEENNNNINGSYDNKNNNVVVEELDLSSSVGNTIEFSEVSFLEAVDKNISNNLVMNNEVNSQIYNSLKNKINQYIANGGNGGF